VAHAPDDVSVCRHAGPLRRVAAVKQLQHTMLHGRIRHAEGKHVPHELRHHAEQAALQLQLLKRLWATARVKPALR
jgi:hypothetical protein